MAGWKTHGILSGVVSAVVYLAQPATAASPARLSGAISGVVTDGSGIPQMGASVFLYNRAERLFQKALTDEEGTFSFSGLMPESYSVKVTLATFIPAIRNNISVDAGVRRILNVSLTSLFSSVTLVFPASEQRAIMSDDWKWVLRTSSATRPVLRFGPSLDPEGDAEGFRGRRRTGLRVRAGERFGHGLCPRNFSVRE
jgi:hypothetical protein